MVVVVVVSFGMVMLNGLCIWFSVVRMFVGL